LNEELKTLNAQSKKLEKRITDNVSSMLEFKK